MLYTIIFKRCRKPQKYEETTFKSLDGSFEGQMYLLCLFYKRVHKIIMPKKMYLFAGSFIVFTENNPAVEPLQRKNMGSGFITMLCEDCKTCFQGI